MFLKLALLVYLLSIIAITLIHHFAIYFKLLHSLLKFWEQNVQNVMLEHNKTVILSIGCNLVKTKEQDQLLWLLAKNDNDIKNNIAMWAASIKLVMSKKNITQHFKMCVHILFMLP